ncbi:MAG: CAP domain-containing protein [Anaerolineae bacterium]|nr:CAP domain-containing protein [Anaerolineae bacterium]MCI0607929.1 CAP domain-containing protein [Anaerolineae bacterium]
MIKKLFIMVSLTATMLSACTGQSPTQTTAPTSSETPLAVTTEAPAATETSAILPTDTIVIEASGTLPIDTSIPITPQPTNPPDCINNASFVTDVTIPDNSNVTGGTIFTKTWRVRNTGTCAWGSGYTLTHYSDEQMSAPASVPLNVTQPGQDLDISVDLRASNSAGTHRGNFVIKNPAGLIMQIDNDSRLWVIINVTNVVTATAATASGSLTGTSTSSTTGGSDSGFANATCSSSTDSAKLTETINAINAYRAQNGLPDYTLNIRLARAAQAHANDMACNKLFVHTGSDNSTPQTRVKTSGYEASSVTENVYGSYPPLSGQGAVTWWINDKTDLRHNQNLLSNVYVEIGVGYSFYDNFGFYVVVFAAPSVR